MADSKQGAYATKAADTDFRRKWDKEEYAEKARKKDEEERERMQENEERMKQGDESTAQYTIYTPFRRATNHLGHLRVHHSFTQAKNLSKGKGKIFRNLQSS